MDMPNFIMRVLIAEDEQDTRYLYKETLEDR